ncbi:MAG: hypothetical protein OYI31_06165 [Chloroflexota bacterium]|nr:hypothetical protein [Chloroflexota bacterium]MDE2942150.1 hypothetical protein [Chloroflexota bacterium]MDE3268018.1 hypothetical protein [Chloroflexota bacterium]
MALPSPRTDEQIVQLWSRILNPESWRYARKRFGSLLTEFNPRYPQAGFIGKRYFQVNCRILLMGINPGHGRGYEARDKLLFESSLRLARHPSAENLEALMSVYREQMPAWGIFSRHGVLSRLEVSLDSIAYMNVLHVNTKVDAFDRRLDPVYRYVIDKFTRRQIHLLQPHAILHLGKHGWRMLSEFWPELDRPDELQTNVIWHPTSQQARSAPVEFEAQLEDARRFLTRRKRQLAASRS